MNATTPEEKEGLHAAELGATMREMRENLGRDLGDVAEDLRIRLVYLDAIENGRLGDLPGSVYVSGFLRAYSNYLGLDGEEIVRQFRMAGVEITNKTELQMPSPVEEGRLPSTFFLLAAAAIAVGSYLGWGYISSHGDHQIEIVGKPPKKLSQMATNTEDRTSKSSPLQIQSLPKLKTPKTKSAKVDSEPTQIGSDSDKSPDTESVSPMVETPASRILPDGSPHTLLIVVRATEDSYVVIRNKDNKVLFSQLMRSGDSYEVPSDSGLLLETGNAGGLQITVDGKPTHSLGPVGEIRRNILLEAKSLLRGVN